MVDNLKERFQHTDVKTVNYNVTVRQPVKIKTRFFYKKVLFLFICLEDRPFL